MSAAIDDRTMGCARQERSLDGTVSEHQIVDVLVRDDLEEAIVGRRGEEGEKRLRIARHKAIWPGVRRRRVRCKHARKLFFVGLIEADFAVLGLGRDLLERRGD